MGLCPAFMEIEGKFQFKEPGSSQSYCDISGEEGE